MRVPKHCGLLALALLVQPLCTRASDSLRCGSRIVSAEARAADILAICGEPDYRDVWTEPGTAPGWVASAEEWYYNFGSNQLLRILLLHDGRLVQVFVDGYGFPDPAPEHPRCAPSFLREGLSKYRVLRSCGEPLTRQALQVYRPLPYYEQSWPHARRAAPVEPVFREEWVYNFGSRALMRVVTLENGRVTDVDNGERGFDRAP